MDYVDGTMQQGTKGSVVWRVQVHSKGPSVRSSKRLWWPLPILSIPACLLANPFTMTMKGIHILPTSLQLVTELSLCVTQKALLGGWATH
jgi:hypothetical protein